MANRVFCAVFPDECRICEAPLRTITPFPVCPTCLSAPEPQHLEFYCQQCRTPFADSHSLAGSGLCPVCRKGAVNFDAVYSFASYEGDLRKLVHLFKYGRMESLAKPLGRFLLRALPREEPADVVMAMPMHFWKRMGRGFNQAELLARPVAKLYGLKLSSNLRKQRYTRAQAGLNEAERQKNLKDSFAVRRPEQIAGKRILLVDDVFTTGATLRAAAKALKDAGAARVTALTLARVDRAAENVESY